MNNEKDFYVECDVCKQRLKNWSGSTPCCGSIAYMVDDDGTVSKELSLFASINGGEIKPTKIKF
jgi:hypothetical protein